MGSLQGVLREEYQRLKSLEKRYLREIKKLPQGSLQQKHIKKAVYPYWVSSHRSKVRCCYVGNFSEEKLGRLREQLALRKKYRGLLKELRENKRQIEKIIHD